MNDSKPVEVTGEQALEHLKDNYASTPLMETMMEVSTYTLSPEAAKLLAESDELPLGLKLNGLISLPAPIASILARTSYYSIELRGLKNLDKTAASELAKTKSSLDLSGLEELPAEVATELAKYGGSLSLSSLNNLSDESVVALSKHKGEELSLNGIEHISDSAAIALAGYEGKRLDLEGLECLSDTAAKALAESKVEFLGLGGLKSKVTYWHAPDQTRYAKKQEALDAGYTAKDIKTVTYELSENALIHLAQFPGKAVLESLTHLTEKAAREFGIRPARYGAVRFGKKLKLDEIGAMWLWLLSEQNKTNIGDPIAKQLPEESVGHLYGLKQLEEAKDDYLAKCPTLQIHDINVLSNEGAQRISGHIGSVKILCPREDVEYDGSSCASFIFTDEEGKEWTTRKVGSLTIDDTTAETISAHQGAIELPDLETITPHQALSFSKHKWYLNLSGLKSIDEELAKALIKHQGRLQVDGEACSEDAKAIFEENEHVIAW